MSVELKHRSVYLGLFFTQLLAVTCNAFLDIQYGLFPYEVLIWSLLYGYSIKVAISQHGVKNKYGEIRMRRLLILGALLTVLVFFPMWGFPRAIVYMLAILQVSYTCTTTTRKQLYMGLLMSLVLVIFASTHYRADWTMLFYLIPFVICVVFTIVSEQINSQADELKTQSLGRVILSGQAISIAVATVSILIFGFCLYLITPQKFIAQFDFRLGTPTAIGASSTKIDMSKNNQSQSTNSERGLFQSLFLEWPSSKEMRMVASRDGMPKWQANIIRKMADYSDSLNKNLAPVKKKIDDLWRIFKKWLAENFKGIINLLILLSLLSILIAYIFLIKEVKVTTWVRTKIDYLCLGVFGIYRKRNDVIAKYYFATERLFELKDIHRHRRMTVRDYVDEVHIFHGENINELNKMAKHFEDFRYGEKSNNEVKLDSINMLYKKIYRSVFK